MDRVLAMKAIHVFRSVIEVGFGALVFVLGSGCAGTRSVAEHTTHRFFLELDRPGTAVAALYSPDNLGAWVRLQEIDSMRRPVGDTLNAWVQHFDGLRKLSPNARNADVVIACFRERQPEYAQGRHVLPGSKGPIYVYMMRNAILAITDERVPYYDVLVGPGGSADAAITARSLDR